MYIYTDILESVNKAVTTLATRKINNNRKSVLTQMKTLNSLSSSGELIKRIIGEIKAKYLQTFIYIVKIL